MNFSEKWGRTIDGAVDLALQDLNVSRDDVEVEVLEEPSKGFLGFGAKLAKVRVTLLDKPEDIAVKFLTSIFSKMNVSVDFNTKMNNQNLYINIIGSDLGFIIGKRGQTLDAIQYLVSLVVNRNKEKYIRIILDAENYREKREKTLIELANKLATKVKITRKQIILEPMNPYERRIIHSALQNNNSVITRSEGEDPYRRVVIETKRKNTQ